MIYPPLLALQQLHPKLCIELEAAPNHTILKAIKEGDVDVGIVTSQPSQGVFESEVLGEEPLYLVLPHDHPTEPDQLADHLLQLGLIGTLISITIFALSRQKYQPYINGAE